jgi:hypothetical protein
MDRFSFYAKNYLDIGQLVKLDDEVRAAYPFELLGTLCQTFGDAFQAGMFAGLSDWECVSPDEALDEGFSFWNLQHHVNDKGPFFYIGELSDAAKRVSSTERTALAPLVSCSLAYAGKGGPGSLTIKKMRTILKRSAGKLKKAGFKEIDSEGNAEQKGLYVEVEVGDLVHVCTIQNREKNFKELLKRVEKLVRALIPLIERASQK